LKHRFQSPSLLQQVADWINANWDWADGDGYVLMWLAVVGLFFTILAFVLKDPSHYEYEPKLASEWHQTRIENERKSSEFRSKYLKPD
jgi:hypothetical protein